MLQTEILENNLVELIHTQRAQQNTALLQEREDAFNRFKIQGFPTIRQEQWKYTNVNGVLNDALQVSLSPVETTDQASAILAQLNTPVEWITVLVVNGKLHTIQYPAGKPKEELQITGIHSFLFNPAQVQQETLQKAIDKPFSLVNRALFQNGVQLEVPARKQVSTPVHVIHYYTGLQNTFLQTRLQVKLGSQSQLSLIESFISAANGENIVVNHVAETQLEQGAVLDHFKLQQLNKATQLIQSEIIQQAQQSDYKNHVVSLPYARFIRNNLDIALTGTHTHTDMHGLYMVAPEQVIDNSTGINHLFPNGTSNQLYKGIIADKGTGTFNGRIFVHTDAQKTNAFQKNANLPLGEHAVINSKPQLEIFADDVRCTHGSALGRMSDQQLFYLQARGLNQELATKLLSHAFINEVVDTIEQQDIHAYVGTLVQQALDSLYA
jgi:Fe-S cluster assembly protein SufD